MLTFWLRQTLVWGIASLILFMSYRLYQRYRRPYLRDWFLFSVIFSLGLYILDLLSTVFPGLVGIGNQTAEGMSLIFAVLLYRPLICIGLLLFLRFITGFLEIRLHWLWGALASLFLLVKMVLLIVLALNYLKDRSQDAYVVLSVASEWLMMAALYGGVAFLFIRTARHDVEPRRQRLRNLGILFFICQTGVLFWPNPSDLPIVGLVLLLPPLIYL